MLAVANVKYIDERVSKEQWEGLKSSTPFGHLPVWTTETGVQIAESSAIVRFLARNYALDVTGDATKQAIADGVYEHLRVRIFARQETGGSEASVRSNSPHHRFAPLFRVFSCVRTSPALSVPR